MRIDIKRIFIPRYINHDAATVLRGLAAIGVFLTHTNWGEIPKLILNLSNSLNIEMIYTSFNSITILAQLAPTAFFLSSGYVLAQNIRNKHLMQFVTSRFLRLAPLFLIVLLITYQLKSEYEQFPIFVLRLLFLDHFIPEIYTNLPNDVMWTISIEFWLSIFLFFMLIYATSIIKMFYLMIFIQILNYFFYFILAFILETDPSFSARFFTNYLNQILLGAFIFYATKNFNLKELRIITSTLILITIPLIIEFLIYQNIPAGLIVTLLSVNFLLFPHSLSRYPNFPWFLVLLGTVCYGIYLLHTPVIDLLYTETKILNNIDVLVAFSVTLFLSMISWLLIERPFILFGTLINRRYNIRKSILKEDNYK